MSASSDRMASVRPRARSPTSVMANLVASPAELIRETAGSGKLFLPTAFMVLSQVMFLTVPYVHAHYHQELSESNFHISAVLDDDFRSASCTLAGFLGLTALVLLEHTRELPRRALRLMLAAVTGLGIVAVAAVRESYYVNLHRFLAAVAFGGAVALLWVVARAANARRGLVAAHALIALVVMTGAAQGLNILATALSMPRPLPSWALGSLELLLVAGFAMCMCANAAAGGARSQKREARRSKGEESRGSWQR